MRRRLIVMRHAKSSWNSEVLTDHARPLKKRGCRDAPCVAARLAELGWVPQYVLSSDSQRTRETYELMSPAFAGEPPVEFLYSLYHCGVEGFCSEVSRLDDEILSVLAVGHNPGWEEVVDWLTGEAVGMTTANAALLEGTGDTWREAVAEACSWTLVDVVRPKEL